MIVCLFYTINIINTILSIHIKYSQLFSTLPRESSSCMMFWGIYELKVDWVG